MNFKCDFFWVKHTIPYNIINKTLDKVITVEKRELKNYEKATWF